MADRTPDTHAIVAAFAARPKLNLSPEEPQRLVEYVAATWDIADHLPNVDTPGYGGMSEQLPLRAAYSNRSSSNQGSSDEAGSRQGAGPASVGTASVGRSQSMSRGDAARKLPEGVLEGSVTQASRALANGDFSPLDL